MIAIATSDFAEVSAHVKSPCRALGVLPIRADEHRAAMIRADVPGAVATSNARAFGLMGQGDAAWLSDDVESITGNPPRSLHTFIADNVNAFT